MKNNNQVVMIPAEKLRPHPDNPRKNLGDLTELTDSIRENGILQNLTVTPDPEKTKDEEGYLIVIGHRRNAAGLKAGLTEFPCVIRELTHPEQVRMMLCENIQRNDLTVLEQAQGFQMMIDLGSTVEQLSKDTGFSPTTIYHRLNIAKLDPKAVARNQQYTITDLIELEKIDSIKERNKILKDDSSYSNLHQRIATAYREQESKKIAKEVRKRLEAAGLVEKEANSWDSKIGAYSSEYIREDTKPESIKLKGKDDSGKKVQFTHYWISSAYNVITYALKPKGKKPEKSEAEKKKDSLEKEIKKLWTQLTDEGHEISESICIFCEDTSSLKRKAASDRGAADALVAETFLYLAVERPSWYDLNSMTPSGVGVSRSNSDWSDPHHHEKWAADVILAFRDKYPIEPVCLAAAFLADLSAAIADSDHITEPCRDFYWSKGKVLNYECLYKLRKICSILKYLGFELEEEQQALLEGKSQLKDQIDELAAEWAKIK